MRFFQKLIRLLRFARTGAKARQRPSAPVEVKVSSPEPSATPARWLEGRIFGESKLFVASLASANTQRAYQNDLRQFISYLRSERLSGESFSDLQAYRAWLVRPEDLGGAGLSEGSANRKFATIRSFLRWLESRGQVDANVSFRVKNSYPERSGASRAFSKEEGARILAAPNTETRSGLMHSLILHFLFFLGLRRSEVVALRTEHFAWTRVNGKLLLGLSVPGREGAPLPLPPSLEELLLRFLKRNELDLGLSARLFEPVRNNRTRVKEKSIDGQAVYYIVKKYAEQAGVERKVSPRHCRATAIENALGQGASLESVRQFAGWASSANLQRYARAQAGTEPAAPIINY
jgi:site-specific recombinase XerD